MATRNKLIADTGFFVACLCSRDKHHDRAIMLLKEVKVQRRELITTWPVLTEVCHLLYRYSPELVVKFLKSFQQGAFEVYQLQLSDVGRMVTLVKKYDNLPMDIADASLVILAEEIGYGEIVSTDQRDFKTYRWKNRYSFKNLFF